jgi:plastocyanin
MGRHQIGQHLKLNMKSLILTLTAAVVAGSASAGDVTGKITLKGTPPAEKAIQMDPACGALHGGKTPTTRFYVADATGGLADCVVYLEGAKGGTPATAPVVVDQKNCEYLPYINSAQVKQTIRVLNSDPAMHNVHPTPTVDGNKEQNKAQLPKGAPLDFSFDKPEKFLRFKCDVHPWMFSYVSIFDHSFHAVSGKDGSFKITGVPDGKYKLVVEHRKGGKVEKDVEVKGGAKADFTIEAK